MSKEVHARFSDNCSVSVFFLHTCNPQYVMKAVSGGHQTLVTSSHSTATLIPECTIQLHILSLCLSLSHVSCRPSRLSTTYIHRYIYTDIHNYLGTYIRSRLSTPVADQQVTSFLSLSVTSIRACDHCACENVPVIILPSVRLVHVCSAIHLHFKPLVLTRTCGQIIASTPNLSLRCRHVLTRASHRSNAARARSAWTSGDYRTYLSYSRMKRTARNHVYIFTSDDASDVDADRWAQQVQ